MATPVGDSYSAASGVTIYGGRVAPSSAPAWLTSAFKLNAFKQIPNTACSTTVPGASIDTYSGMALVGDACWFPASGGHQNSDYNGTVMIDFAQDAPVFVEKNPQSTVRPAITHTGQPYYADGKPTSRHLRHMPQYMPEIGGIVLFGARDVWSLDGASYATVDVFNITTNTWAPAGTYADVPGLGGIAGVGYVDGGSFIDANGDNWTYGGTIKMDKNTLATSRPLTTSAGVHLRYPWATAHALGYSFGMCRGDGFGGSGLLAIKQAGNVQTNITFNSSAALTQLLADSAYEAGMEYDEINGYFLFYAGNAAGNFYKVTPNAGTVWDISLFSFDAANNDMPPISANLTQSRLKYLPLRKGFLLIPSRSSNAYFMRTA